jgi:hypothetical protein
MWPLLPLVVPPICIEMFVERQLLRMMVRLDQSANVYGLMGSMISAILLIYQPLAIN